MKTNNNISIRPAVEAALKKLAAGKPRVGFIVDATASRQPTWDLAAKLQAEMFSTAAGAGLEMQLVFFRGFNELAASPWLANPIAIRTMMERVICRSGHTQIERALRHVKAEHSRQPIAAAILIGDACEEVPADIYLEAQNLGVPAFTFLEGDDPPTARLFQRIAELTHGAHAAFGPGSAAQLAELLRGVAAYASGGIAALEDQDTKGARFLLTQLRGPAS
jgi:hypothetical protein